MDTEEDLLSNIPAKATDNLERISAWLYRMWEITERDTAERDPGGQPLLAYPDWVAHTATDRFDPAHDLAKYYRSETEPQFDL